MTALGDDVNVAARLSSSAAAGEVLATEATWKSAGLESGAKRRRLALKGKSKPVNVRVLQVGKPIKKPAVPRRRPSRS